MILRVEQREIPVTHAGGGELVFACPTAVPGDRGEFSLTIDGVAQSWPVRFAIDPAPRQVLPLQIEPR